MKQIVLLIHGLLHLVLVPVMGIIHVVTAILIGFSPDDGGYSIGTSGFIKLLLSLFCPVLSELYLFVANAFEFGFLGVVYNQALLGIIAVYTLSYTLLALVLRKDGR